MLTFRNPKQVLAGAVILTSGVYCTLLVYLQQSYPPEMMPLIRGRAVGIGVALTFPISLFFFWQMYQNFLLSEKLRKLVDRDRLTNVATRDFFYTRLAETPDSYGISLMVDIDHFKRVNDTHGHLVGDKVITHVAGILAQEVRRTDIVCRYGGEEFVIFLDRATAASASVVAERIRARVEASPVDSDGLVVSVTVSIGGSLSKAARDIDAAIQEADQALYEAKNLGRNRVVMTRDARDADRGAA